MDIENKIFTGDSIEFMRQLPHDSVDVIITDPPWPNGKADIFGKDDPWSLWSAACQEFPRLTGRLVVVLGCQSDVRFLANVPAELPFLRVCWLKYVPPRYKGPILDTADIAYVFGKPWLPGNGVRVMGGECQETSIGFRPNGNPHPCYRPLAHMSWLVRNFSRTGQLIFDPFCGSGNILLAAAIHGRRWCGVEIEEKYADFARAQLAGISPQERLAVGVD
jgi:DNA modification methylase